MAVDELTMMVLQHEFSDSDVIGAGAQTVVLAHPHLDVVLKVPRDDAGVHQDSQAGYELAADSLGGLVAPFVILPVGVIRRNGVMLPYHGLIVQQRATEFYDEYEQVRSRTRDRMIRETIEIDREMFRRGVVVSDTYHKNFGVIDGNVTILDAGKTVADLAEGSEQYGTEAFMDIRGIDAVFLERGFCLHNRWYELGLSRNPERGRAVFAEALDLPLIPDYQLNMSAGDIAAHEDIAVNALRKVFHPLEAQSILDDIAAAGAGSSGLLYVASKVDVYAEHLLNDLHRAKYKDEFIATGRAEFERFYDGSSQPVPVEFPASLLESSN